MENKNKEDVIESLKKLHIKLHYKRAYDYNSIEDLEQRIADLNELESLKEYVRNRQDWNTEEISKELSERIRKATSLNS